MTDCLENIIGITQNECDCWEDGKPSDFDELNASSTGHYVTDEKDGFPLLPAIFHALDCGRGDNIWTVLLKARQDAIRNFKRDLGATLAISHDHRERLEQSAGLTERVSGYTTYQDGFNGLVIQAPRPVKGGVITVQGINVGFESTDPVTISISSDAPDFSYAPVTVTPQDGYVYVPTDWVLPMYVQGWTQAPRYIISYDATGHRPRGNRLYCCSGDGSFGFARVTSFSGDLPEWNDTLSQRAEAYGLSLDMVMACDKTEWLCRYTETGGYELPSVIANTLQFQTTQILAQFVLDSNNVSRYTTLSREALYGKRNHAQKRYNENITWLSQNVPKGASDCLQCSKLKPRLRQLTL